MNDTDFEKLADQVLARVEAALEESGLEADIQLKDGGVLEIEFEDGTKLIVNRHRPAREIWVAARSGGFHFRWDGALWRDSRSGDELFAALSRLASLQGGQPVLLRP
jgi:CyaY protein